MNQFIFVKIFHVSKKCISVLKLNISNILHTSPPRSKYSKKILLVGNKNLYLYKIYNHFFGSNKSRFVQWYRNVLYERIHIFAWYQCYKDLDYMTGAHFVSWPKSIYYFVFHLLLWKFNYLCCGWVWHACSYEVIM